jgi:hypothetical protein
MNNVQGKSKRDLIWEQKRMSKAGGQANNNVFNNLPSNRQKPEPQQNQWQKAENVNMDFNTNQVNL